MSNPVPGSSGTVREPSPAGTTPEGRLASGDGKTVLTPGTLIEAQVVEPRGAGEGLLDIAGRLFRALYPEGLPVGERLSLRVVSLGPPLVLRLPDPSEGSLTRLLSPPATEFTAAVRALLASAPAELGATEQGLLQQIQAILSLPASPGDLARALARLVAKSGVFHEASLAAERDPGDLKALAQRLLPLLPRGGEGTLARALEALLGHVAAHQARSLLEGMPVIPFALPWGSETVRGEWTVEERSGRDADGTAAAGCVRLRLHMPRLGHAEVVVRWGPTGTSVRLGLQPGALEAASAREAELSEALASVGGRGFVDLRLEPLAEAPVLPGPSRIEVLA